MIGGKMISVLTHITRRMRRWSTVFVTLFALTACSSPQNDGPKLYVMDCGEITFTDISFFSLKPEDTDIRTLFVPCYLITHQGKTLMWDVGLPLNIVGKGVVQPNGDAGPAMVYQRSVVDQLADLNLAPDQIDYLALSHMHYDHTGAANLFTRAKWLVQRSEYDAAFSTSPPVAFVPDTYAALKNNPTEILQGDYDVFGDGSVTILSTPGHTPGHQMLLIDLAKTGKLLLSGDLYHFRASRALQAIPLFNTDIEQSKQSMAHIEDVIQATGATLWIEHDKELAETLNMSPAFYD